jgi:hypothetical protein
MYYYRLQIKLDYKKKFCFLWSKKQTNTNPNRYQLRFGVFLLLGQNGDSNTSRNAEDKERLDRTCTARERIELDVAGIQSLYTLHTNKHSASGDRWSQSCLPVSSSRNLRVVSIYITRKCGSETINKHLSTARTWAVLLGCSSMIYARSMDQTPLN